MAKAEIEGQITPKEWTESQFLRAVAAWNKLSWKAKGATVGGLLFLGGIAGWRFHEGIGSPTIPFAEGTETTLDISQAQIPPKPEIVFSKEVEESRIAPVVFTLNFPSTLETIAEIFEVTQQELIQENPWLFKKDLSEPSPWSDFEKGILKGYVNLGLPSRAIKEDVDYTGVGGCATGIMERGIEGKILSETEGAEPVRATLFGLNRETGRLVVELQSGNLQEIEADQFICDAGLIPKTVEDENYGKGLDWELEFEKQKIKFEVFGLPELYSQQLASQAAYAIPKIKELLGSDLSQFRKFVVLQNRDTKVGAVFSGVNCDLVESPDSSQCDLVITQGVGPFTHELIHASNIVLTENGDWMPVFSRVIDEGLATYFSAKVGGEHLIKASFPKFFEETLAKGNTENLREETLRLDQSVPETYNRYAEITAIAGWAFKQIDEEAVLNGKPEFLSQLLTAAREKARESGRSVTATDLVNMAGQLWDKGPELIEQYHVLFMRAAWE